MPSDAGRHRHSREEEREIREAALDRTIEASFPASDPPSSNPNPVDEDALERRHQVGDDRGGGRLTPERPGDVRGRA
jgi:hypothetical protein